MTVLYLSLVELVLVLAAVGLVLARWAPAGARRPWTLAAAGVVVASVALAVALGPRWQIVPVVAGGAVPFVLAVIAFLRERAGHRVRRARWWLAGPGTVSCLAVIALGPTAAWAFPVPEFPTPSGPHPVGTTVLEWTDQDRAETFTAEPDDRRTVVAQLWYPARADTRTAQPAQYLGRTAAEARTVSRAMAAYLGLPPFLFDDAARARTHAVPDAPVAAGDERFPLVLFSPGLGFVRTQNTAWAEDLASRGYVVAGLDHPYDSAAVVLRDGRTIRGTLTATDDDAENLRLAERVTAVRAADLSFVLTRLSQLDREQPDNPLTGRLAVDRTAVTGMSAGGAAALQAARQDTRFAAAINLDGYPYDPPGDPIRMPVLGVTNQLGLPDNPKYLPRLTAVLERGTAPSYRLTVTGTTHATFSDGPLYLPPVPAIIGTGGRARGPRVTADITAAYLDSVLRQQPGDLARVLSAYGELVSYRQP